MIKNYFKIAWRNLIRNKVFSFINVTGLAMGLACCLMLAMYLQHELSFDRFHGAANRIVRVIMDYKIGDHGNKGNFTSAKVSPEFKRLFPEVETGVRLSHAQNRLVSYEDKIMIEKDVIFADSTFFSVFDFTLLSGRANEVLKSPNMVVLTQTTAKKYFGNENPVGKTLLLGSKQQSFLVTGVSADCPGNSQLRYDMVVSLSSTGPLHEETYSNANYTTYLLMNNAEALPVLQQKINSHMQKENASSDFKVQFELEPFTRVHLYSPYDGITPNSNITYIYIIMGVALLVLIIACFTYINLSTARSAERAREVGIRKVSGALRGQVFWRFIIESVILTFIALVLGIALVLFALPAFNQLADVQLSYRSLMQPSIVGIALLFILAISLLAGSYPALLLSGFQPVKVLKGAFKNSGPGIALRRGLIVFQFVVSAFLIISTMIIRLQMQYIQQRNLGYTRDHVIVLDIDQRLIEKLEAVKNELSAIPAVKGISLAYESPVTIKGGYNMSGSDPSKSMSVRANPVDESYVNVMGLEIVAGNNLSRQDVLDATQADYTKSYYHFILNESAAKALGWEPKEAVGKKMYLDESRPGEVKAVVRDFHFESLHTEIEPLVLFPGNWSNNLFLKTDGGDVQATIRAIASKWKQFAPHRPFTYHFLDEDYNRMYHAEMRSEKVFALFSGIAIFLACLGLFGMSVYTIQQRVREIGIRKVLGAGIGSLVALLSKDFLKLVGMAILLAYPVSWWAATQWLNDFAYRVDIGWWVFILAGGLCLLITLVTVSFQAIKAAITNPIKSLRTE